LRLGADRTESLGEERSGDESGLDGAAGRYEEFELRLLLDPLLLEPPLVERLVDPLLLGLLLLDPLLDSLLDPLLDSLLDPLLCAELEEPELDFPLLVAPLA